MNCWARSLQSWVGGHGLLSAAYKRQSRKREKKEQKKVKARALCWVVVQLWACDADCFHLLLLTLWWPSFGFKGGWAVEAEGRDKNFFCFFIRPSFLSLSVRFLRGRRRDYKHARDAEASVGCHPISFQRIQIRVYTGAGEKTNQRAALVVLVATRVNFRLIVSTIVLYRPSFSIMQRSNNHRLPWAISLANRHE